MTSIMRKEIFIESKETISYLYKQGGKKTLILLHGNMSSSDNFEPLINNLSADYTVYAVDMRGFGDSSYMEKIIDLTDLSVELNYFTKAIGIEKFSLLGWSLGGNVAMRFAIDYPEKVENLILMASGPASGFPVKKRKFFNLIKSKSYIRSLESMKDAVKMIEKLKTNRKSFFIKNILKKTLYSKQKPTDAQLDKYVMAVIKQRNLSEVNIALSYFNITDRYNGVTKGTNEIAKIKAPVLLIHGDQDKVVDLKKAKENLLTLNDTADLKILNGGDHALMFTHLDELTKIIETFV